MLDRPLKILNFAVFLQQQRYMVAISYLFYLQNGLGLSDFLLFQSIFYLTSVLAEIPAGYIGDIFPRKNILIFSYLLFIVRIIMWIICPNYYTILLGEILYGLSKAFYRGVSDGYIYDYLKEHKAANLMLKKYGKFNFFMSLGTAISCLLGAWLYKYLGFTVLLSMELLFNSTAVILLMLLPHVTQKICNYGFRNHLNNIYLIIKESLRNSKINVHILYSSILFGITSIFVWNFQPIMKTFALPVSLFGIIYFINHTLRALCALNANRFIARFSLAKFGFFTWLLYLLSFSIMINLLNYNNKYLCFATLIFVCIAIGIYMVFNVGNLSRIHEIVSSDTRATISSINNMFSSLCSVFFLMFFKFLVNHSQQYALTIFMLIFAFSIILVRMIYKRETT